MYALYTAFQRLIRVQVNTPVKQHRQLRTWQCIAFKTLYMYSICTYAPYSKPEQQQQWLPQHRHLIISRTAGADHCTVLLVRERHYRFMCKCCNRRFSGSKIRCYIVLLVHPPPPHSSPVSPVAVWSTNKCTATQGVDQMLTSWTFNAWHEAVDLCNCSQQPSMQQQPSAAVPAYVLP